MKPLLRQNEPAKENCAYCLDVADCWWSGRRWLCLDCWMTAMNDDPRKP